MVREFFRPIQVELGLCIHCERCAMSCPNNAIKFNGKHRTIDYNKCRGCFTCVNVCPRNAITVTSVEDGDVISIDVDYDNCSNCETCSDICPKGIYEEYIYENKKGESKKVQRVPPEQFRKCSGCEICADRCPESVIRIQKMLVD